MIKKYLLWFVFIINIIFTINASTTISTCTVINSSYSFDTDRTILLDTDILNQDGNCMTIADNNLILDCDSHLIQGDGDTSGFGINFFTGGGSNITIKNCNIESFNHGISRTSSSMNDIYIQNNNISNNRNSGFFANTAGRIFFSNNYFFNNSVSGIHMRSGWRYSTIENNIFNDSNTCFYMYDNGPRDNILRNNIFDNCGKGIWFERYARFNLIYDNIFINNVVDIYLHFGSGSGPHDNLIYNNTLNSSKVTGNSINLSFFNLSTTGNIWLDFNGSNPFCFGTPSVCDNFPSAYTIPTPPQAPPQTSSTSLPSISTYTIIISLISILLFL